MNAILAFQIVDGLMSLAIQSMTAAQAAQAVIGAARAEDRDLTDAEMADIKAASHALTHEVLAKLKGLAERPS